MIVFVKILVSILEILTDSFHQTFMQYEMIDKFLIQSNYMLHNTMCQRPHVQYVVDSLIEGI